MTLIRAEIRKWRRTAACIEGLIYNDKQDIYDDGEPFILLNWKDIREGSTFFLVETENGIYKLEKEERS